MQNTIHIQSYNIVDFLVEIEKNVKNGYTFDFVSIGNFPQLVGGTFIVGMVKDAEKEVKNPQKEVLTIKIDASEVQAVVDKAVEEVKTLVEASELEKVVQSTQEELKAAVEAPKKAGRPAKGK